MEVANLSHLEGGGGSPAGLDLRSELQPTLSFWLLFLCASFGFGKDNTIGRVGAIQHKEDRK